MQLPSPYSIELLYQEYYDDIYHYVLMMHYNHDDIEDIVQNTFIKAIKGIGHFRGDSNVKTWLFTIARNECIRYPKSKHVPINDQIAATIYIQGMEDNYCNKEITTYISEYIVNCQEPIKSLLALRLEGRTFVEIGHILQKSDVWCRVTFMRKKNELITNVQTLFDYSITPNDKK